MSSPSAAPRVSGTHLSLPSPKQNYEEGLKEFVSKECSVGGGYGTCSAFLCFRRSHFPSLLFGVAPRVGKTTFTFLLKAEIFSWPPDSVTWTFKVSICH